MGSSLSVFCPWQHSRTNWPGPVFLASWVFAPAGVYAMGRPPQADDPPPEAYSQRRPHLVPPDELTTHVGNCCYAPLGSFNISGEDDIRDLAVAHADHPWGGVQSAEAADSDWLGVFLHTPHYQTQALAVKPAERNMCAVTRVIHKHSSELAAQTFDTIVPLRPQRFAGFASLLRFSSAIRCTGLGGQVAIVFDLSHVGGHYFAAVLPRELSYPALLDFVLPLTNCHGGSPAVYVGGRARPWPPSALVKLSDGDVVTVLHQHYGTFARHHVETLFQPGAYWDYPHNMPHFHPRVTTCVLHCNARYSLPGYYHVDQSIVDYVCQRLRLDPYSTVMCSFPLQDLDVQGDHSPFVVAVADVPSPNVTGLDRSAARDIFVLIDPRPLGLKPHFLFVHQPLVHLPTVITLLGLSTPAAARIGVKGGIKVGDDIKVDGSTALVLFAEADDLQEFTSDDASQPDVSSWGKSPNHVVQAYDHDLLAGAADPVEQRLDLAAEYSTWEEGTSTAPAATASSDYQDPTLPPGHSWNAGASDSHEGAPEWTAGAAETPVAQTAIVPSDDTTAESTRLQALVYEPDFVPEIVDVVVALPTTVFRLVSAVGSARLAEQSSSFPALYAAYPQPVREFAVFLAAPDWQIDSVSVLLDCRRVNGCFFAKVMPRRLNRESILAAAGFRGDDPVSVHLFGRIQPLGIDQRVDLTTGQTIHIVPRYEPVPHTFLLADMLTTTAGWDSAAPLPGARSHFNSHFWILSDAQPFTFPVADGRRDHFREDLIRSLGAAEHRLSIKASEPRIIDSYGCGYWASGVLVATEEISPVPCPPALQPETRLILILDQRRILRGFKWHLVPRRLVKVQDIADRFYDICPFRHTVSIRGAEVEEHDSERYFSIVHGQVLVIDFTLETDDAAEDEAPPWDQSPDDHPGRPYLAWAQSDLEPDGGDDGNSGAPTQAGLRSRSPRERTRHLAAEGYSIQHKTWGGWVCSFNGTLVGHKAQGRHYGKWSHGILQEAKVVGNPDLTPAQAPFSHPSTLCLDAATLVSGGLHIDWGTFSSLKVVGHKLLEEPVSSPSSLSDHTRAAREATRLLGGEWPFPPFRWPIVLPAPEDDDSQEDVQEFGSFVDVAFYLLTPGYIVEQVDMSIVVPQLVGDVLDLVQTCRLAEGRQKFPVLVPVEPQPDPGWGVLLALPAWLRHRTVICLDLSLFDGRIISVDVPANLDFHVLCESAGLSPHAGVDIYLPGAQEPLLRGADCLLWTGACVAFRRPGARRHVGFDLEAMLATRAGWEHSPVFPRDRLDNGYCVVSQQGERLFRLQPERAFYYKADIALLTGLHPLRVIVTPASSQPDDVSVNGWVCRAVVAATDRQERYNWDGSIDTPTICILDCRAAFLGWGVVHTWEPWIDLEPIRHSLNQSAPDGWCAAFPGFPSHWTWACVEPGQLIVVFCA